MVPYADLYPLVRSGGLFLTIVGVAIVLGSFWFRSRNLLLGIGAALATVLLTLTAARLTAPYGVPTATQVAWLAAAVVAEIAALAVVIPRFAPRGERALLAAILIVVGVHFLPMAAAFGPLVAAMGLACTANAAVAMRLPDYPLRAAWAVDGGLKVLFGAWMWWIPALGG